MRWPRGTPPSSFRWLDFKPSPKRMCVRPLRPSATGEGSGQNYGIIGRLLPGADVRLSVGHRKCTVLFDSGQSLASQVF
jgi:hypothetical protein